MALEALGRQASEVVGHDVKALNLPDHTILNCLQREKSFFNVKKDLMTDKGRVQYLATGRAIRDSDGADYRCGGDCHRRSGDQKTGPIDFGDRRDRLQRYHWAPSGHHRRQSPLPKKIAATDAIVSIRGASGTGKELFARAIHSTSGRKGPFVPINCAALPEQLLESELFGYAPGRLYRRPQRGQTWVCLRFAQEGTLFFDEIAEMPLNFQAKILRTIQERTHPQNRGVVGNSGGRPTSSPPPIAIWSSG